MKLVRFTLIAVLFFCSTSVCSGMPSVRYQVDKDYPPYTFQNRDYLYGFDFSLATLIFDTTEYNVDYSTDAWPQVYKRLVNGEIDIGGIIAVTEERKREVLFTKPLFSSYVSIYTLQNARKITIGDLPNCRVGVGKGYYTETILRDTLKVENYQAYDEIGEAITDLLDGKIDVIFENQQLMEYMIISKNRKGAIIPQVTNLFPREHAYAVSKKRPELVEYMNRRLEQLKEAGVFEELYVRFFYTHSDSYLEERQQKNFYTLGIIALLLVVGAIGIKRYVNYLQRRLHTNYHQLMAAHEELQAKEEELLAQNEELQSKEDELIDNYNKIRYTALHDNLTGLPNRAHLNEWLTVALENARRNETSGAVLFIDLDDLKTINDSLGHRQGDALIIKAGALIVSEVEVGDFVSRIGGDEFIAILPERKTRGEIACVAEGILHALSYEHDAAELRLQTSASIGVALYPEHGDTADEILKNADNAMYAAKRGGKNCWRFYEPSMQAETYEHMTLKAALRSALRHRELAVVYQPQVSTYDHRIIGFEALLRWKHPQYGMVAPSSFIPLAEQTGLIHSIGEWVLQEACLFARRLADGGWPHIRVGVNASPVQLSAEAFIDVVQRVIHGAGIEPSQLELEITETALMSSLETVAQNLSAIHGMGVRLALDDFGTGYSSLTYLDRLPVNTLKLDKSFIDRIVTDPGRTSIIGNMVDMAHGMSMTVVAEGVETAAQVEFLTENCCDFIQGYYFGRPVPEREAMKALRQGRG